MSSTISNSMICQGCKVGGPVPGFPDAVFEGCQIVASGMTFKGWGNKVTGNKNIGYGDNNTFIGNDCVAYGNHITMIGDRNKCEGTHNVMKGSGLVQLNHFS